jgi:hypothetical protein
LVTHLEGQKNLVKISECLVSTGILSELSVYGRMVI